MNRLNQMNNRDKEIYRFISTKDFSKTYSVDIGKRMQQLNKYFTPDRLDPNYDHWGNLSTTKGIKEFVSNKQTMREFVDAHEITSTKGKKVNYLKNSKTYKDTIGKKNNKANRETFIRRYIKGIVYIKPCNRILILWIYSCTIINWVLLLIFLNCVCKG